LVLPCLIVTSLPCPTMSYPVLPCPTLFLPCPWLIFSSQEMFVLSKGPGGGICNLTRRFFRVTSRTLNLHCAPVFKHVFPVLVDALSLWTIVHAGISRFHPNICPSCRSSVLSYTTKSDLSSKKHIFLSDLQCPPPFRATMTTSNKVAALPNPNLAIALAGISRSESNTCPSCRSSVLSYTTKSNPSSKKTHFSLRSTMSASISSNYDNVEQSCSASKP
jgi:hypothetical protein